MKILDFNTYNEKQKVNSIKLSELKDIKIDGNDPFKKDFLKTFDIVKFNNRLYMVFANSDIHQFRDNPFDEKVRDGIFVRYEESEGLGFMFMNSYNYNLILNDKGTYGDMWDVKELYVFPGVNKNPDGPEGEPIYNLRQLTQERLESIIKDFKYKKIRR